MNDDFTYLAKLSGSPMEQAWLQERLETLSVREGYILAAATARDPPESAGEAVRCHHSLYDYEVYFPAASYEELGAACLTQDGHMPMTVLPYADLHRLGEQYEDQHPGLFIGACYVVYPNQSAEAASQKDSPPQLQDDGWSVKLKLASSAVPGGVWVRLPDYAETADCGSGEITLALHELKAVSLEECVLLDAKCILPNAGDLMKQYNSVPELVRDGNNLGFVMDERGQGEAHWLERFSAALEYEECHSLRFALDISQNLKCYDWVPRDALEDFATARLRSSGVWEEAIRSGCVDLKNYAEDLLETSRYRLTRDGSAYVIRNTQNFTFDHCTREETEGTPHKEPIVQEKTAEGYDLPKDVLNAFPLLSRLSKRADTEESNNAEQMIREVLTERGSEGLRQLRAAMEYENCSSLEDAAWIASHLDSYGFVDAGSFQNTVRGLLESMLNKRVIDRCFDFDAFAAIKYGAEDLRISKDTGLYVYKSVQSHQTDFRQEQSKMTGQTM